MKKILSILVLLALLAVSAMAAAESSATYMNDVLLFDFKPGSEYSATDLFTNFKNVLPGDTLTQRILVQNSSGIDVRMYVKQSPETFVQTDMPDFLGQMRLKVEMAGKTLFDAPASEAAQMKEPVLLGIFKKRNKNQAYLDVTLEVPIEMSSEYMNQVGVVPWTFIVEEVRDIDSPHTGDWYENGVWLAMAGALAVAILAVLVLMRRRRRAN
ncbi:MAG: hypothetical protein IKU34_04505 [Clostridia bacterium]|nr:hypothetical protein [Clostridia bacterium]